MTVTAIDRRPATWANDYVTKMTRYAEAGVDHYWILDTEGVLDVMIRDDRHYLLAQQVVPGRPARIPLGDVDILVDVDALLR